MQQAKLFRASDSDEGATTTSWYCGRGASNASKERVVKRSDSPTADCVSTPMRAAAAGKEQMCRRGLTSEGQRRGSPEKGKHGKADSSEARHACPAGDRSGESYGVGDVQEERVFRWSGSLPPLRLVPRHHGALRSQDPGTRVQDSKDRGGSSSYHGIDNKYAW